MLFHTINRRMIQLPLLDWANKSLIFANVLLGAILIDHLNFIAAGVGIVVTITANLGKIAESLAHLNAIRRNGWLPLTSQKQPDNEGQNESN